MNAFYGREVIFKENSKVKMHISKRKLNFTLSFLLNAVVADNMIDSVGNAGNECGDAIEGVAISRNTIKIWRA